MSSERVGKPVSRKVGTWLASSNSALQQRRGVILSAAKDLACLQASLHRAEMLHFVQHDTLSAPRYSGANAVRRKYDPRLTSHDFFSAPRLLDSP